MEINEEDRIRLLDIERSIREIQGYIGRLDYLVFTQRDDIKEAVMNQLLQIGGAAALLSDEFKDAYGDIDWDVLKGLQYANFDQEYEIELHPYWHIITNDLPEMVDQISDLVTQIERDETLMDETFMSEEDKTGTLDLEDFEGGSYAYIKRTDQLHSEDLEVIERDLSKSGYEGMAGVEDNFGDEEIGPADNLDLEGLEEEDKEFLATLDGLDEEDKEMLTRDLSIKSTANLIDQEDDSFIDQRFEDVDLMESSSLDDDIETDEDFRDGKY